MTWTRRTGIPGLVVLLLAGAMLSACGRASEVTTHPNPLAGAELYVDPTGNAVQAVGALRNQGRDAEARLLQRRIASRPTATWLTTDPAAVFAQTQTVTKDAVAAGTLPVMVAYNIPGRDCGLYSSGGARDVDAYLDWVGSLAAGIGDRRAVLVLEPDAVAHSLDGCVAAGDRHARLAMLAEAVKILKRQPHVHVYVDAGNASWVEDRSALASALRTSGIAAADGFALNVANFETTRRSIAYGRTVSRLLGGAHFVVDTSRNGAGPPPLKPGADHGNWCNPPGRRLGTPPTTSTRDALVDALLWVKQPGDSDGSCGAGAPGAGTWWPRYAEELLGQPVA